MALVPHLLVRHEHRAGATKTGHAHLRGVFPPPDAEGGRRTHSQGPLRPPSRHTSGHFSCCNPADRPFLLDTSHSLSQVLHHLGSLFFLLETSLLLLGLLWRLRGKEFACNAGDTGDLDWIPELGRCPGVGNGNPLQHSCLENPMDRGACWFTVHGPQKSLTQLTATHTHVCVHALVVNSFKHTCMVDLFVLQASSSSMAQRNPLQTGRKAARG